MLENIKIYGMMIAFVLMIVWTCNQPTAEERCSYKNSGVWLSDAEYEECVNPDYYEFTGHN